MQLFIYIAREIKQSQNDEEKKRYCPGGGRPIPWDVDICPYCKKYFIPSQSQESTNQLQDDSKE